MSTVYPNPDLQIKYKENSSFRQLMDDNKKQYDQKSQQSFYSDLSKVNSKFIHITSQSINQKKLNGSKIYSDKKHIIYIYSHFQPQNTTELHKYFLYFITSFPQYLFIYQIRPQQPFHLIYVNSTQTGKGKCWSTFKTNILQELPLKYLLFMEKLVLIRPSLLDKASSMIQFGIQNKFFSNKLQKYDCLKSYFDSIGKKFEEMKKTLPCEVLQDEPDEAMVKAVFSSFICNFDQNRTSIQGQVDLEKLNQTLNSTKSKQSQPKIVKQKKKGLQNYPTGQSGIPLALQLMIFYFTEVPIRCQTQGLFRKCTSIDEERELISQLQKQNYEVLTKINNEIAVASTLKRFLSNLQPPAIPYQNYQRLIEDHSLENIIREIHILPLIHFMTLMHLLKFLCQHIIPFSKKNLMTLENVAICFAPCLMKSKQVTLKQLILATISVEITKIMLMNFEQIFGDAKQQKRISNKTYRLYRKNSKIIDSSKRMKIIAKQIVQKQNQINVEQVYIQCPQDFLRPVTTILDDENQSSIDKLSQRSSEILDKNELQKQQIYGINIVKVQKPKSDIYLEKYQQEETKQMKKHKSYKKLVDLPGKLTQICRKSDCDKNDIAQEQLENIPNSQGISRLNKLRVNRSKMSNV